MITGLIPAQTFCDNMSEHSRLTYLLYEKGKNVRIYLAVYYVSILLVYKAFSGIFGKSVVWRVEGSSNLFFKLV